MNRLNEQERAGLEEVFLSISTHKGSLFKEYIARYHAYTLYSLQQRIRTLKALFSPVIHPKVTLKTTTSHKNTEK